MRTSEALAQKRINPENNLDPQHKLYLIIENTFLKFQDVGYY